MFKVSSHSPSAALRWFSRLLGLLSGLLLVAVVIAVPLIVWTAMGRGTATVKVSLRPPYSIGLDAVGTVFPEPDELGRRIDIGSDARINGYVNFPIGEEASELREPPTVTTKLVIQPHDRDTRWAVASCVSIGLALAWFALDRLRRVVTSARDGDPFDVRNVRRIRHLAAAVAALPLLQWLGLRVVDSTLDSTLNVEPAWTGTSPWVLVPIAVGLLALAEVFKVGSDLQDLEQATI